MHKHGISVIWGGSLMALLIRPLQISTIQRGMVNRQPAIQNSPSFTASAWPQGAASPVSSRPPLSFEANHGQAGEAV